MQGQVQVAPARWWHVPGLARLIRETRRHRSDGGTVLWAPHWSPWLGLLQSVWTAHVPGVAGPRSYVAEHNAGAVGLAQMRPQCEPHQWEVVYLAVEQPRASQAPRSPGRGVDGAPETLMLVPHRRAARLLGELCDAAVLLGAERIMALISEEGGHYELFKQIGFSPVVREFSYFRQGGTDADRPRDNGQASEPVQPTAIAGLRRQRRADAFGLLQLYQECTPKIVQMAEGKRSRSWDLPVEGFTRRLVRRREDDRWVVERDARKVAWLHLSRAGRGPHTAQLMVAPGAGDLIDPLLQLALAGASGQPAPGMLVRAREHQPELMTALEGQGFQPVESRLLMVKLLAAPVRHQFVPALEKVV